MRRVCTSVHRTGRLDRSPLHFEKCFVYGMWRLYQFVKTSNESPEKGLRCTKIRIGDRGGPSRAICVLHCDSLFACFLSFCLLFPSVCFLPSVFSHGRTQNHTLGIVPFGALKNGDRWVFSYGRTTTTVRTRPYDGSRSSVRSQSQVLRTVKMGSADAFFALEKVYLCERTLLSAHSGVRVLKYLTRDFLIGRNLRKYASAENAESGKCGVKTGETLSL